MHSPWNVWVVYLLIPTSNHNEFMQNQINQMLFISWFLHQTTTFTFMSYFFWLLFISWFLHQTTTGSYARLRERPLFISWFLHQTTTGNHISLELSSCLSLDSYIKPQPYEKSMQLSKCCLSLDSYIKPQLKEVKAFKVDVVYLLIPTSNHNLFPPR